MLTFFIGVIVGGVIGVTIMCLLVISEETK